MQEDVNGTGFINEKRNDFMLIYTDYFYEGFEPGDAVLSIEGIIRLYCCGVNLFL